MFIARPPGSKNKRFQHDLMAKAQELDVDPFTIMLLFAKGDWQALGYSCPTLITFHKGEPVETDIISPELRFHAAMHAASYLYPKRKELEIVSSEAVEPSLIAKVHELFTLRTEVINSGTTQLIGHTDTTHRDLLSSPDSGSGLGISKEPN